MLTGLVAGGLDLLNSGFNTIMQHQNFQYQKGLTREMWHRDDTAIQRRVADLKSAGLSPVLAAGSGASTSSPISTNALHSDLNPLSKLLGAYEVMQAKANLKQTQANIDKTEAEKNNVEADTQWKRTQDLYTNLNMNLLDNNIRNTGYAYDYALKHGLPINGSPSTIIKTLEYFKKEVINLFDEMFGGNTPNTGNRGPWSGISNVEQPPKIYFDKDGNPYQFNGFEADPNHIPFSQRFNRLIDNILKFNYGNHNYID